ncbi:MAG: cupin domain-containing protein, partial [Thermoanaerobaculia bacterium]
MPFELKDLSAIPGVPCPCGTSRRAFVEAAGGALSLHLVEISKDAVAHYHKRLTEVYYFLA